MEILYFIFTLKLQCFQHTVAHSMKSQGQEEGEAIGHLYSEEKLSV